MKVCNCHFTKGHLLSHHQAWSERLLCPSAGTLQPKPGAPQDARPDSLAALFSCAEEGAGERPRAAESQAMDKEFLRLTLPEGCQESHPRIKEIKGGKLSQKMNYPLPTDPLPKVTLWTGNLPPGTLGNRL